MFEKRGRGTHVLGELRGGGQQMPTVKGVEGHGVLRGMPFDVVYKRGQRGRPLAVPTVLNNPATRPYPDAQLFGGRDALFLIDI